MTTEPQQAPELDTRAEEGLLETAVSIVTEPVPTMRRLTHRPRIAWAIVVTVALAVLSGLVGVLAGDAPITQPGFQPTPEMDQIFRAMGIAFIVLGPLFALAGLALGTGVLQLSSYLLGGRGGYAGLFTGLGFAQVPQVFGVPLTAVARLAGGPGAILSGLLSLGLWIWGVALATVAIRENHDFSTGRALAALLIPFVVLVGLFVLIAIVFVAMFASRLNDLGG
jgi:hypothetical protein